MAYEPLVSMQEGGDKQVVASGGELEVQSGGIVDIQAGAKVTFPMIEVTTSTTVTAAQSGATFLLKAVDLKMTLPSTAAGLRYTFIVHTVSTTTGAQIDPAAADAIHYATSVDDKDLINTPATDVEGDAVTVVGDGDAGWWVESTVGTWAKEA